MRLARGNAWALALVVMVTTSACRRASSACGAGPRVALVAPTAPVGFDADFTIEARALCPEARAGTIAWRALSGASTSALTITDGGFTARARTPTLATAVGAPLPWGLVPLSPRTRGEVVLEAMWRDGAGAEERQEVRVAAAPRARGLPNTALGTRIYFGGAGWHVDGHPPGAAATLEAAAGTTSLVPDVAGDWRLVDGAGRALVLRAGRYDETPLDCGRAECHAAIAAATAVSPMTRVLARGLAPAPHGHGAAFGDGYPSCALACHATGEPGLADGGFTDVMGELGIDRAALGPRRWEGLPRPLRRLGGVGCLACHGPGALPEASARWSILRTDVCATCHDAPARYGHVQAWRTTRMARADHDARAATEPACTRCHTTWGFLAHATADAAAIDRRAPAAADVGPMGIACAACHAVHEHGAGAHATSLALLRTVPRPALLADAVVPAPVEKSQVCLACHTPDPTDDAPSASTAALWLGRGGLDPATGAPLTGPTPHAALAGGCVGCHRTGPAVERGAGHAFVDGGGSCAQCHAKPIAPDDLAARARSLWTTWLAREPAPGRAPTARRTRAPYASIARRRSGGPRGTSRSCSRIRPPPRTMRPTRACCSRRPNGRSMKEEAPWETQEVTDDRQSSPDVVVALRRGRARRARGGARSPPVGARARSRRRRRRRRDRRRRPRRTRASSCGSPWRSKRRRASSRAPSTTSSSARGSTDASRST